MATGLPNSCTTAAFIDSAIFLSFCDRKWRQCAMRQDVGGAVGTLARPIPGDMRHAARPATGCLADAMAAAAADACIPCSRVGLR